MYRITITLTYDDQPPVTYDVIDYYTTNQLTRRNTVYAVDNEWLLLNETETSTWIRIRDIHSIRITDLDESTANTSGE